jgi:hypothetical protein
VFFNESSQRVGLYVGGDECANLSFALHHANNGRLGSSPATRAFSLASVVRFVHLNSPIESTNRAALFVAQHGTNLLEHTPCGFVGYARLALNLLGADPAPRLSHEVDRIEPCCERSGRFMKDRVGCWVNMMAAMIAGVGRTALDAVMLRDRIAGFAKDAVREQVILEPLQAGSVIWKLLLEVLQRVRQHVRLAIVVGHIGVLNYVQL